MYLLLAFLQICAAAARLAKIRICDLFRSAAQVDSTADAPVHSLFSIPRSSSRRRLLPAGDAGLAPSGLYIASKTSVSLSLAAN